MGAAPAARPACHQPQTVFLALWGLALIGIIFDLTFDLALPPQAVFNPAALGAPDRSDTFVWSAYFVFAQNKFGLLTAILFGALCRDVLARGERRRWLRYHFVMAVLLCAGLAHWAVFLAGNLMGGLALAGICLTLFAGLPSRALYAAAIGLVALHVGGTMVMLGGSVADFYQGRTGTDAALFAERAYGSDGPALADATAHGREGLDERIARARGDIGNALSELVGALPLNLAGAVLGMALAKDRLFAGEWRIFRMQRLAGICAVIAIPALIALAWWPASEGFPGALIGVSLAVLSAPFDVLLAMTYAVLGVAFLVPAARVTGILAAAGRMALSNYLIASLLLAGMFAGWGAGLFAELTRLQVLAIGLAVAALALLWSALWLRIAPYGPVEWFITKLGGPAA
ncbi:DUF418 domain-containing protein [Erythrobacter sp. MTPC3]|uniref:DUF418 domain-containing protein n=1 Tax=Erythrobacter sp. MTPC3 TaxID=3056564 RepID=UPI0036F4049B